MYSVEDLLLDDGFIDYCINNNSPNKIYWDAVIIAHPEYKETFLEAKTTIIILNGGLAKKEITAEIEKVKSQLYLSLQKNKPGENHDTVKTVYINSKGHLQTHVRKISFYAAACVLLFCVIIFFRYAAGEDKPVPVSRLYSSGFGNRKEILLPDGSAVILNSNSSITVAHDYNRSQRLVELSGEAFFKVAGNAAKPFIVQSKQFSATALGTAFYVHARNAAEYKVELLEGKVNLKSKNNLISLLPGQAGVWHTLQPQFTRAYFDSGSLKKWVGGKISFDKIPVPDAVKLLEKWYAADIQVSNKNLHKMAISGDFDNVPLQDVLQLLCFSLSCRYTNKNGVIIIE